MITADHGPHDAERFRRLGHGLIDKLADHLAQQASSTAPVLPLLTPTTASAQFLAPANDGPAADIDAAFFDVVDRALSTSTRLHAPGFVGHQVATPLPTAALFDLVSSLLNNGMAIFEMGKGATAIERAVLVWLTEMIGLPSTSTGVLTSGGSIGNMTALLAARQAKGNDPWRHGVRAQPLVVFVADTAHYSVSRALRVMGLGNEGCVSVAVDERLRMDIDSLKTAIAAARKQKKKPIAVIGSAGSTAAGAIDPLNAIADVCAEEDLWFHVDGAHGAPLMLLPEKHEALRGIERADSVVADFHKMLAMPALCTGVLFRDGKAGAAAFAQQAGYLFPDLEHPDVEAAVVDDSWADVGRRTIECTKTMIGLKVWGSLQMLGRQHFVDHVRHCTTLATTLSTLVKAQPELELLCEPEMNIVCFRVRGVHGGVNAAIREQILAEGAFYPVQVHLHARGLDKAREGLWLRCALQNPHTTTATLEALITSVVAKIPR